MRKLEKEGFEVVRISTRGGKVNEDEFLSALDDKTLLISMMLVNNETGAVYDIKKLFAAAKRKCPDVVTHCDAVQGFMKVPFTPKILDDSIRFGNVTGALNTTGRGAIDNLPNLDTVYKYLNT